MSKIWAHEGFCVENNTVWFVPFCGGFLCEYNLARSELISVNVLCDDICKIDRYINTIKLKNKVFTVPSYTDFVCVYDVKNEKTYKYELIDRGVGNHYVAIGNEEEALVFPFNSSSMIRIHISSDIPQFEEIKVDINGFVSGIKYNDSIYLIKKDSGIYQYIDGNIMRISCVDGDTKFIDMAEMGCDKKLLLLDESGSFYIFAPDDNKIVKLSVTNNTYYSMTLRGEFIYAFPKKTGDYFDKYEIKTMTLIERYEVNSREKNDEWAWDAYSKVQLHNDKIYVMNIMHQCLMEINEDDTINYYSIDYPDFGMDVKLASIKSQKEKGVIKENAVTGIDLKLFISALNDL